MYILLYRLQKRFYCLLYNAESKELSEPVKLMANCMIIEYGADIQYISEKNKYILAIVF